MSWSVKVEILSITWLGWGEVSALLIVEVLQKSESGEMVMEVSRVRSLDAGCPSPGYLSPGFCTKRWDVLGVRMLKDMSGFCLSSQTQMLRL